MLIAMAGLPGTGKSTLARSIASALSAIVLDKDTIRAALFPPQLVEYSTEQDDFCMSVIFQVASYIVQKDAQQHVILDGRTFSRLYQVLTLQELAAQLRTPLKIIECFCSDNTARQRLTTTTITNTQHPADNRNYALYLAIKARFEPIPEPKLLVDTDNGPAQCLAACLSYIQRSP
jgi:predicted kinase